jgi:predicted metal-binding protein
MSDQSSKLKAHLFVCTSCTYDKPDGTESSPEEAVALRKNLKNRARECFSKKEVRVSASTCLGECDFGIASVLYPKGEWNLRLRLNDEEKMFQKLSDEVDRVK